MMFPDPKRQRPAAPSFPPIRFDQAASSTLRRFDELCDSDIIHAHFRQRSFAPHTHDTWTIGWVEQGANRFRRGRTEWVAGPGTVCVVNPGEVHTGGGEAMTYWNLMPSDALLARVFPHTAHEQLFLRDAVVADAAAVAAIRRLFSSCASAGTALAREQAVVDGLAGLFMRCARIAAADIRRDNMPSAARMAQEFIEAHLDQSLSLATLAGATGLSLFHFCRVFEAAHGMPPAAYVRNRRVHRARQLIGAGAALADAAVRAGFADQPHMTRQFRAVLGITPAQWRARG
ncbi:helix-turn-helix domain-containing protein [Massilia sp. CCM 8733]|uniref:Helix-turn-helix domain-containing protein n=1 Tax=Massilia mucilaginosa TaxID=2609282 RepID=A0ABX0NVL3_9BURK|nr:AraC family transcriptional regulator [Massilia mucilaginosa]NHZ90892.1 helix-turn-helix domain-containing protein [Massilia mucilaginosa]